MSGGGPRGRKLGGVSRGGVDMSRRWACPIP